MRWYGRSLLTLCLALSLPRGAAAQDPPYDAVAVLARAYDAVRRLGETASGGIWPGFRPDTTPVQYVLPDAGTLLFGWGEPLPDGFTGISDVTGAGWQPAMARAAASTSTQLEGRGVAQVVVGELDLPSLVGITVHEQFHVFQGTQQRPGRRFGGGENSFLVTSYPVFDVDNETGVALEGRLLAACLSSSGERLRELAHEFLAVREGRQRELGPDLAEFEMMAELNEGLAQYAGVRALQLLAEREETEWRSEALAEAQNMLGDLGSLISEHDQSFRLRFYVTGPAISLLLDRTSEDWKTRLVEENLTLQDALAGATGYRERESALRAEAEAQFGGGELRALAEETIVSIRALRRAQVDSIISTPGVQVVILTEAVGGVGFCGIDPQNIQQVDDGVLLHTRWFKPCRGRALQGEFTAPVVHDQNAGTLMAVIGSVAEVDIRSGDESIDLRELDRLERVEDLKIDAPGLTLRSALADLELEGAVLRIRLLGNRQANEGELLK